ncbi:beta-propeller fold lactonase family protein [Seonamhaeicola sp. MEBiC1930]|uniref:beta-propeller fold lactonase family protein n=1 Tax=Seonamhaeicola sp. MEBiC01930 TaxID=2976768 RepID=UPI003250B4C1
MRYIKLAIIVFSLILVSFTLYYFMMQPTYSIKMEGDLYVVNKASKSVTVFDLLEGEYITEINLELEPHEAASLTNPNRIIVTNYGSSDVEGKSITVINSDNNNIVNTIELGDSARPHGIIQFPDSKKVGVVTDIGNDLSVINIDSGELEKQISTQQDFSHLLVHHPYKPLVYVSNINSGSMSVIDINLNKVIKIVSIGERAEGIDISKDGSEIWVTNIAENFILVINTETNEIVDRVETGKEPLRLSFTNDGKFCLVSNSGDGNVSVFNVKTRELVTIISIPGKKNIVEKLIYKTPRPVGILMHPNGLYAFVSNLTADRVEVIDMKKFAIVSSIEVGEMPDGLAMIN